MNDKESELWKIVDIVVGCCATDVGDGKKSVTSADVLGPSRSENVVMTRCILVEQILGAGYSVTTAAQLLKRSVQAVRHMREMGENYRRSSRAYRVADAQATLLCRDM